MRSSIGIDELKLVMNPVNEQVLPPGYVTVQLDSASAIGGDVPGSYAISTDNVPPSLRSLGMKVFQPFVVPMCVVSIASRLTSGPSTEMISAKKPEEKLIVVPNPLSAIALDSREWLLADDCFDRLQAALDDHQVIAKLAAGRREWFAVD